MELAKELAITEDFKEGPRAFIEKRAPRWTGR
jgi:enoyl-CoA hydratase/carnithine racemase